MSKVRLLLGALVASLTLLTVFAFLTPVAQARPAPDGPGVPPAPVTSAGAVPVAASHGSSIWLFVLVAALTAIVSITLTLLAVRVARRSWDPLTA
jgi:hypothetical protein